MGQLEEFEQQVKDNPEDVLAHYNLAVTLQGAGREDEAVSEYKRALETDKDGNYLALVHYNLGALYYRNDKLEDAIIEFEQTVQHLPRLRAAENIRLDVLVNAHNSMGMAFLNKTQKAQHYGGEETDLSSAEENFRKALKLDPSHASARKNLENVTKMAEHGWCVADPKTGSVLKFFGGKGD